MYLVLLGAPGAGKGTQGALLAERLNIPKIATGDILRDAVDRGVALGREAKRFMDAGELVPDQVILGLVCDALDEPGAERGAIFDGYPRTVAQAEALQNILAERGEALDAVALLAVPDEVIITRLGGRRICSDCKTIYNVADVLDATRRSCAKCGGTLQQRSDDEESTVRRRLEEYRRKTAPVVAYYEALDVPVRQLDGDRPVEQVQSDLERLVQS
jgi:adenylate kinase